MLQARKLSISISYRILTSYNLDPNLKHTKHIDIKNFLLLLRRVIAIASCAVFCNLQEVCHTDKVHVQQSINVLSDPRSKHSSLTTNSKLFSLPT